MRILIIGGTIFLGRHLVEAALARGHAVTLFNRGLHNRQLFPQVEHIRGDRDPARDGGQGLAALRGRRWDAVIDTCGYVPRVVQASAGLLADAANHYTYISSISAYADYSPAGIDETAPLAAIEPGALAEAEGIAPPARGIVAAAYGPMYGPLKALCEQAAEAAMPGRVLVIRPGMIVGPFDYSDRMTYWVARVAAGGEVLAPGRPERQIKLIDARDLAEWNIRMIASNQTGVFNAAGPEGQTMGDLLEVANVGLNAHLTWVEESFLIEQGVQPWSEMPLWLPEELNTIFAVRNERAISAGLAFRPLGESVRDTLAWLAARPAQHEWQAGLSREREAALLEQWHQRVAGA